LFKDPVFAREAVECLYRIQMFNPFFLFGFVVMPDHCHFLLHVPEHGSISYIMQMYKRAVSFNVGMGSIWQTRFHLRVPDNAAEALKYIHLNPIRAGLSRGLRHHSALALDLSVILGLEMIL
jgi:REP element-mobilizing transposase RayT